MSTVSPPEPFVSTSVPGQPTEPDDGRIEPSEKMFGIARRPVAQLSQEDIDCLYRELRVTKESHNVRVVFVKGTDDMTRFAVEKIFAEYHPCRVEIVDKSSCLVSFASRADCVRMMIGMTKPLRRFRATRAAEDGELTDSDGEEEEGQIKQEKGDDVALVANTDYVLLLCDSLATVTLVKV
ncbi:hypothetical protein ANCCEY_08913 [Ancylostoma ceylanicum]|uniref:Uncharacterized protein n=1 Tax=Ancylostoma ceylanicum TaxID=53326 RepID=A0A0D6LJ29_9BILA|nr:hypothetical protein ANCCEY_08913 [Ancylostoma ceylanicum]